MARSRLNTLMKQIPRSVILKSLHLSLALVLSAAPCLSQHGIASFDTLVAPFGFSRSEIDAAAGGAVITKELSSGNPAEIAVVGAVYIPVPVDFATDAYLNIESFKTLADVPEIGRFSTPPAPGDLNSLTLDDEDIQALGKCSPGHCMVKLSAAEMKRFRKEIRWDDPDYRERALSLMKELILGDARSYLSGGNASMGEYDDQSYPLVRAREFDKLLRETPSLVGDEPGLFTHLEYFPRDILHGATDIIFWQKEQFEKIKPVVSLNHMTIYRPDPAGSRTMITLKQIYATHHFEASLVEIALIRDPARTNGFFEVYLRRSSFDDLRKSKLFDFSKEIRRAIYQKVKEEIASRKTRIVSLYNDRGNK